ncbi:MAG TPA: alpha/beta fold hydrolase [Gaiellaceae bacterium]|nr:alpha/beta fold hydrolase [Gaiellaceae bacterium]
MIDHTIAAPDGRVLHAVEDGDPSGFPVVVHHGTPGCALLHERHVEDAAAHGIRLVAYDRPGYGGSSRHAGRSVGDAAADVATIADALGFERLATWGISGGGPHALATAALLPDRVVAAASLAAVAPYDADGLDFLEGMGEMNIEEFHAALEGEAAIRPFHERAAPEFVAAGPGGLKDELATLLSPVDAAELDDDVAAHMYESFARGLANGVDGWVDDDLAFAAPWGFDVAEIAVPLLLWQGVEDRFVPPGHGRWLAARIPGVEARVTPDDGHLTLYTRRVPEVHTWLLERASA